MLRGGIQVERNIVNIEGVNTPEKEPNFFAFTDICYWILIISHRLLVINHWLNG